MINLNDNNIRLHVDGYMEYCKNDVHRCQADIGQWQSPLLMGGGNSKLLEIKTAITRTMHSVENLREEVEQGTEPGDIKTEYETKITVLQQQIIIALNEVNKALENTNKLDTVANLKP